MLFFFFCVCVFNVFVQVYLSCLGYFECDFIDQNSLTGLGSSLGELKYVYFKCRDISINQNTNKEPYSVTLRGSEELNITSIYPEDNVYVAGGENNVTLGVRTEGGANGDGTATCKYTRQESAKENYYAMDDELNSISSDRYEKQLILPSGKQIIYVGCVDAAGNPAFEETEFNLLADNTAPGIIKSYWNKGETLNNLVIELAEEGICEESQIDFEYGEGSVMLKDGNVHETTLESDYYHIMCQDSFNNTNTEPYVFYRVK